MNLDKKLLKLLKNGLFPYVLTVMSGLIIAVLIIFQADQLSTIINKVIFHNTGLSGISEDLVIFGMIILLRAVMIFEKTISADKTASIIKNDLQTLVLNKIKRLGPVYSKSVNQFTLVNNALQGIEELGPYFSQYLPQLVLAIGIPAIFLIYIFPIDTLTAIIFLITAPLIPIFMVLIGKMSQILTKNQWNLLNKLGARFLDTVRGLETIKQFNYLTKSKTNIAKINDQYRIVTLKVLRYTFLSALVLELIGTLSTAVVAVEIGLRLLYGTFDFQSAFFLLLLAPEFYLPLRTLGLKFHAGMKGIESAVSIFNFLNLEEPQKSLSTQSTSINDSNLKTILGEDFQISFTNVHLDYQENNSALKNVSFRIFRNQITMLSGKSGAGKSSIANLLMRFAEPTSGQITINDIPINSFDVSNWQQYISWIPQTPVYFSGTVKENLFLGSPSIDERIFDQIMQQTKVENFVSRLPDRYNQEIFEYGRNFSAGQSQRIAFARALIKQAPIIIIDEPAAHLDPETITFYQTMLPILKQNHTVLIIAHRPNWFKYADRIIHIKDGSIEQIKENTGVSR